MTPIPNADQPIQRGDESLDHVVAEIERLLRPYNWNAVFRLGRV